jgi:hypothetical protein
MAIPQVAEVLTAGESVRCFWCWSCAELFAFVGDSSQTIGFAEDGQGGWKLFRAAAPEHEVHTAVAAMAQVRPDRTTWDRIRVCRH